MRWRRLIWLVPGLLLLAIWWRVSQGSGTVRSRLDPSPPNQSHPSAPARLVHSKKGSFPLRLSNTSKDLSTLMRSDRAVLLENAILDTEGALALEVPQELRCPVEPGAYIVQARGNLDGAFRALLTRFGAHIVSYIPNNALLIRASSQVADQVRQQVSVQAVISYEPYFKLKPSVLEMVLNPSSKKPEVTGQRVVGLRLVIFPDGFEETRSAILGRNLKPSSESASPFGPVIALTCAEDEIATLARLPGVQAIELGRRVVPAMDLGRAAAGIASTSTTVSNYLGLTGSGATVCVIDGGIDTTHPGLAGRVTFLDPEMGTDSSGHGTHIAGIIAGNGAGSLTVTNAPGSPHPPVDFQFRGVASAAKLVSLASEATNGPIPLELCLQQAALAAPNALIVNNSWGYANDNDYDLAAAICDAAARDALPGAPGPHPLLNVFAAGNQGGGSTDGTGGRAGSICSPATAKNVLTVGALEKNRWITNQTWTCTENGDCNTNLPWLPSTDSNDQVASFSSRGNVGIGSEGVAGRSKPDLVAQGTFVISSRSAQWDQAAYYARTNSLFSQTPDANYSTVLSNLNESLGPRYRFESGTSLAAAQVSGTLALAQEFFARLGKTNSPAGYKALLINGARPVGSYPLGSAAPTNAQGWGQLQLPTALHRSLTNVGAAGSSMFFFDQNPTTALASGQSLTRGFELQPAARALPLRVTLVWTDPPGNPVAGVKLVNDLDLVVTNLDTGEVYLGNDLVPDGQFSRPWDLVSSRRDLVNNVESVLLASPLASHYSVTVVGRRINVNALSSSVTNFLQDFALVVASGDGEVPNALSLESTVQTDVATEVLGVLTNQVAGQGEFGCVLWPERVGAGSPVLSSNTIPLGLGGSGFLAAGVSNQWRFYVLTNDTAFTNAAFATFLPAAQSQSGGSAPETDIDLYVSTDPAMIALDPVALAAAAKSLKRGGSESIILSNATPGVYYIGVKCESRNAAEFGLAASLSDLPFAEADAQGLEILRGFPAPQAIPGPGVAALMCVAPDPLLTRRVIVTNSVLHPDVTDLQGMLTHGSSSAVLNNFSTNTGEWAVYDDSGERSIPGARVSDGPGSLNSFAGTDGSGEWLFTMRSTNYPGTNEALYVALEPQIDTSGGVSASLLPGACRSDFVAVPPGTTNLTAAITLMSGTGPIAIQLLALEDDTAQAPTLLVDALGGHGVLTIDETGLPPIHAGNYRLKLCNLGPDAADVTFMTMTTADPRPRPVYSWASAGAEALPDDAVYSSVIAVTNLEHIESGNASIRIEHPRISDLVLHLVSPSKKRVLLQENRGGASADGLGTDILITNVATVSWSGGPEAFTNVFHTGQTSGTVMIDYNNYSLPDTMHVYYESTLLFDSGLVSGAGATSLSYGPGSATWLTIVMNEGGNSDTNTAWYYHVVSTRLAPVSLTFTENTNLASTLIKFAPQPLTNITYSPSGSPAGIFYLPEQSLDAFTGEPAAGDWKLEIEDTRAGPADSSPRLVSWQLDFQLQKTFPVAALLGPGQGRTNLLAPRQVLWFAVAPPLWASVATNRLLFASLPVNLLLATNSPAFGVNPASIRLLASSWGGDAVLQTNGSPAFVPGVRYYLGIQNTDSSTVTFALQTDFDVNGVVTLEDGVPLGAVNNGPSAPYDYYRFVVGTNAVRAQFEINAPSENVSLFLRRGLPLPSANSADYSSANSWTNDELIVVYDYSRPVPLTPGEWYLSVLNLSANPAAYTIFATTFPAYGTNITITDEVVDNGMFCLTWTSLPGLHYFVQAKVDLAESEWITVSPTLTAVDVYTSFCQQTTEPFAYFRVSEGLVLASPPLLINSVSSSPSGVLLEWTADPGRRFKVEWSESLDAAQWSGFGNLVTSTNSLYRFLDSSAPSGSSGSRFYRIQLAP